MRVLIFIALMLFSVLAWYGLLCLVDFLMYVWESR